MNKYEVPSTKYEKRSTKRAMLFMCFVLGTSCFFVGCTWDQINPFKPPLPPPPPVESFTLRNGTLVADAQPKDKSVEAELAGAREYFRREEYAKAEKLYHRIESNEKNSVLAIQEAYYYEAECLRLQGDLPKAADTYAALLQKHMINPYKDLAIQHLYDIANFWLQDTWDQVRESQERREGKRKIVWPRFVSFDKRKPLLDREGRAVERLRDISLCEGKGGAYSDKAMYLCGYVAWFNEDYADADQAFSDLNKLFPESPYAPYAIELAIKAKLMSTGGEMYDGRKVADARKLVDQALRMPEVTQEKKEGLMKLLKSISTHQAEKDYQMAEFWRRTGHPGSAYFYYEIVRRRYPGTETYIRATNRMNEIYAKMQQDQREKLGPPPEAETRPVEPLGPPRRIQNAPSGVPNPPEGVPMPQSLPGTPEAAPMPQRLPASPQSAPPPRPLPGGLGGN